jgi:hypothetical protein
MRQDALAQRARLQLALLIVLSIVTGSVLTFPAHPDRQER